MTSTQSTVTTADLIPLALPRQVPTSLHQQRPLIRRRPLAIPAMSRLRRWWRAWLPSITSHRNAMEALAEGYEQMARDCEAHGQLAGAAHARRCAEELWKQLGR